MTKKTFHRTANVIRVDESSGDHLVELAFSSEEPVERFFGTEILDHDPSSVRLGRLQNDGPVLLDHRNETDSIAGVVKHASIDSDRVGRARIKFSLATERARQALEQIREGTLSKVSIGYQVHRMQKRASEQSSDRDAMPVMRVVDWEPMEISLVAVPADDSVGLGRSLKDLDIIIEDVSMDTKAEKQETREATRVEATRSEPDQPKIDTAKVALDAVNEERFRVNEIETAMKMTPGLKDIGEDAIRGGLALSEFRVKALEWFRENQGALKVAEIGMSKKEVKQFSFFRLIRALSPHAQRGDIDDAGFELEASRAAKALYERSGQKITGAALPNDVWRAPRMQTRDLTAGTATDGAELVATDLMAGNFIDVLRPVSTVMQAGAMVLPGLVGDVAIPRMSSGAAFAWINGENVAAAESEAQFDQVTLTPLTGGAWVDISRQLTLQSTPAVEGLIRDDFAKAAATAIDLAALYGSGASGEPEGIVNTTGIYDPSAWAGVNPTFAEVIDLESGVAEQDVNITSGAYIMRPNMAGYMKGTPEDAGAGLMMWRDNRVNGYPAFATSSVTDGDLLFGNFSDLMIGSWGGLDIVVDPYTGSTSGRIRIVVLQSVDVAVRHPESFAIGNDTV